MAFCRCFLFKKPDIGSNFPYSLCISQLKTGLVKILNILISIKETLNSTVVPVGFYSFVLLTKLDLDVIVYHLPTFLQSYSGPIITTKSKYPYLLIILFNLMAQISCCSFCQHNHKDHLFTFHTKFPYHFTLKNGVMCIIFIIFYFILDPSEFLEETIQDMDSDHSLRAGEKILL